MTPTKGSEPAKISSMPTDLSASVALTVNTEIPNGGVSNPASTAMMVMMPKWIRSKPKPVAMGAAIGTMISRIDEESSSMPSSRMMTT